MVRKSKDSIIKSLQKTISSYEMYFHALEDRQSYLAQLIEDGYKNCPTYYFQQEKLDFMEKLYNLNNSLYDSQKLQNERLRERLRMALLQLEQQGIEEYHIGDYQLSEMKDQIRSLKEKVKNREETIKVLNDEITGYQQKVANLKLTLSTEPASQDVHELKNLLKEKSDLVSQYQNQLQSMLIICTGLLLRFHDSPTITQEQLNDALKDMINVTPASPVDIQPLLQAQNETQLLKDKIAQLEMELSQLDAEKPQYGRPPKISQEDIDRILSLVQGGWSYRKISNGYGYSLGTISRICKKYKKNEKGQSH